MSFLFLILFFDYVENISKQNAVVSLSGMRGKVTQFVAQRETVSSQVGPWFKSQLNQKVFPSDLVSLIIQRCVNYRCKLF